MSARAPDQSADGRVVPGTVRAELATAMVQLNREFYGRGPTRARVSMAHDVIVVTLEDALTAVERALLAEGETRMIGQIRERTGAIKRAPFVRAVEGITGRRVRAFVTGFNEDPPVIIDTFVLEPAPGVGQPAAGSARGAVASHARSFS